MESAINIFENFLNLYSEDDDRQLIITTLKELNFIKNKLDFECGNAEIQEFYDKSDLLVSEFIFLLESLNKGLKTLERVTYDAKTQIKEYYSLLESDKVKKYIKT